MKRQIKTEIYPRSILLSKEQYKKIYPYAMTPRRIPIVFSHNGHIAIVEEDIAAYLMANYDGLMLLPLPTVAVEPEPEPEIEQVEDDHVPEEVDDILLYADPPEPEPEPEPEIAPKPKPKPKRKPTAKKGGSKK